MTRKKSITPDEIAMGPEPQWTDQFDISESDFVLRFMGALNWYNYFTNRKTYTKTLLKYMKGASYSKDDMDSVKKVKDSAISTTLISVCQMKENGLERSESRANSSEFLQTRIQELIQRGKEEVVEEETKEEVTEKPKPSIQERMASVAREHISEFDFAVDEFIRNGYESDFDSYEYCRRNDINAPICKKMLDLFRGEVEEVEEAVLGEDEQLVEGYNHMSKSQLKNFAEFLRGMYDGVERHANNTKTTRKPRKTKPKPAHKVVSKVKFLKEAPEYKIVSVDPTKIVGAEQLWAFNVKTRTLWVYNASGRNGLTVKGTTLQGYDEETSIGKRLRKPEEVIDRLLGGGKIVLRKLMSEIRAVDKKANGRLNDQTILLRII